SAVTHDRDPPIADELDNQPVVRDARTRPIEESIAQGESLKVRRSPHRFLEIVNSFQSPPEAGRGARVEWILLSFDRTALARKRPAAEALRNESPHSPQPAPPQP